MPRMMPYSPGLQVGQCPDSIFSFDFGYPLASNSGFTPRMNAPDDSCALQPDALFDIRRGAIDLGMFSTGQ